MKIAVLGGGGAMGGMFGGYLARAGEDVVLIDVFLEAVEAIDRHGLVVEAKDGSTATIRGQSVDKSSGGRAGRSDRQFRQMLQHGRRDPLGRAAARRTYDDTDAAERLG